MPLTNTKIRAAKPADKTYRLSDEKGMYLEVTKAGGRYWRMKYRHLGKEKRLALGVYPETSLAQARAAGQLLLRRQHEGAPLRRPRGGRRPPVGASAALERTKLCSHSKLCSHEI